jgi:hypothetical protein
MSRTAPVMMVVAMFPMWVAADSVISWIVSLLAFELTDHVTSS